jgi:regulator of PEP synthase PpsR (kinase-PPPase family)
MVLPRLYQVNHIGHRMGNEALYQVFAISDATGTTAERVVQAALTQFGEARVSITRHAGVRSPEHARRILDEAEANQAIIVHTLVSAELRELVLTEGRQRGMATIDLMGPLLARLATLLAKVPRSEPGLFRPFDDAYLSRVDAIRFTVNHDDGRNTNELSQADIVLVGVSRTCKTPVSVYLATQGWRVANVPLVIGLEPPAELFALPKRRVAVLMVEPERLAALRQARVERLGTPSQGYADLDGVRQEIVYAYELLDRRPDWPIVDMSAKSIEEAATEIVSLVGRRVEGPPDQWV